MARPDIEAIRERTEKATPGPWTRSIHVIHEDTAEERVTGIGQTTEYDPDASAPQNSIIHLYSWGRKEPGQAHRNAEFIAHAREDVPDLLAYIAELEARRPVLFRRYIALIDRDGHPVTSRVPCDFERTSTPGLRVNSGPVSWHIIAPALPTRFAAWIDDKAEKVAFTGEIGRELVLFPTTDVRLEAGELIWRLGE